jgi:hypothetical protein
MTNNPEGIKKLCDELKAGYVVIIARWSDPKSNRIVVQDFIQGGESFIPLFSNKAHFFAGTQGSGFEHEGVSIKCDLFLSMLKGDELLILNPGSQNPLKLRKADFF